MLVVLLGSAGSRPLAPWRGRPGPVDRRGVGNLTDRLFRDHGGAVVDFIDFQWWPVFNVADIGIIFGALLLVLASARSARVRETVPAALAGERVDRVVALLTGLPRSEVAALVEAGGVRLGGSAVSSRSRRVAEGEVLEVDVPEVVAAVGIVADPAVALVVVHADEDVVVVDKPAGLVVHPGAGNPDGTLVHGLLARFPEHGGRRHRPDPAGDRAPPGQGHVGAARRGPLRSRPTSRWSGS